VVGDARPAGAAAAIGAARADGVDVEEVAAGLARDGRFPTSARVVVAGRRGAEELARAADGRHEAGVAELALGGVDVVRASTQSFVCGSQVAPP